MKEWLVLIFVVFLAGCGATTQIAQVQQGRQKQAANCRLKISYNCPEPVVGQPYSCAPVVTTVCIEK